MCKYVIVITVIARQDVDGHFGTTLNIPAGLLSTCYVRQLETVEMETGNGNWSNRHINVP